MAPVSDDIYKEDVDFALLSLQHAGFAKKLKANGQLDFSDPESVLQLTKALLKRDFNLTIDLPDDRLCPPVPNRFNYIVFIQKLLASTQPNYNDSIPSGERMIGLDIGTGASAIYPLLACRQSKDWLFLATEIDDKSREYARQNGKVNSLESRIKIIPPDQNGSTILPTTQFQNFDDYAIKIQLTNPPFYTSTEEMQTSTRQKSRPPNSACTGSPIEMITPGGETQFISRIITESMLPTNRTKIQWFSSMLGKLSSVSIICTHLRSVNCTNYVVTQFVQGETRRWCVAWSWASLRPPSTISRSLPSTSGLEKKHLPFPNDFDFDIPFPRKLDTSEENPRSGNQIPIIQGVLDEELSKLDLIWSPFMPGSRSTKSTGMQRLKPGTGKVPNGDVWSRKARRQKNKSATLTMTMTEITDHSMRDIGNDDEDEDEDDEEEDEYDDTLSLAFRITVLRKTSQVESQSVEDEQSCVTVHVRWLQGHESVLFESFCGWLKRKVESRVAVG